MDSSSTPVTRDFIGLCIGILSVIIVILIVAVCKWSRCLCLKRSQDMYEQTEPLSAVIQQNAPTSHSQSERHRHHNQRQSSYDRPGDASRYVSNIRHGLLSPSQPPSNGHRSNNVKVPRVTITTLPVQPSQQLVPRLSTSPQVSSSSLTPNTYSIKQ